MTPRTFMAIAVAACLAAVPAAAVAQETVNQASISGRVVDPQGAVVPGAVVTARNTDTNLAAESVTDQAGRFRFPYLRVGPYEITVRLAGFADVTRTLTLTVGSAFEVPVMLAVAGVTTDVTVTGQVTVLEAARSQIAGTVSQAEVQTVPMNGRNFLDLALLIPGVSPTNVGSTQLFAETSAVPGQGLSVGSQRNFSNNFIVDGLSANDDAAGLSGMPYGVDAVDQFQVVTSGAQAELGRALGGYINVLTKSGTNVAHGDLYGYFRDDRFNAPNALTQATLPMNQKQYGGSLGGPIVKDRTFFFGNVEQRRLDQTGLVTIAPDSVDTINARLSRTGYPGADVSTGVYPNPVRSTQCARQDRPPVQRPRSGRHPLQPVQRVVRQLPRRRRRRMRRARLPVWTTLDQTIAFSNTMTLSPTHRERNTGADLARRSECAADRSVRSRGQHRRRGVVRHALRQSDASSEHVVRNRQQPLASGRRARASCGDRRAVQRRHDHVSALHSRRLHVLVAGQLPVGHLQQFRLHADVRHHGRFADESQRRRSTRRTSGRPARR